MKVKQVLNAKVFAFIDNVRKLKILTLEDPINNDLVLTWKFKAHPDGKF